MIPGLTTVYVPTEIGPFEDFEMGGHHYCATPIGGGPWSCWGWNAAGQLGNGDAVSRDLAVALSLCTQAP